MDAFKDTRNQIHNFVGQYGIGHAVKMVIIVQAVLVQLTCTSCLANNYLVQGACIACSNMPNCTACSTSGCIIELISE